MDAIRNARLRVLNALWALNLLNAFRCASHQRADRWNAANGHFRGDVAGQRCLRLRGHRGHCLADRDAQGFERAAGARFLAGAR